MTRRCQKRRDLQRIAVVDEVPAAREEVGEEDIAERGGDMVGEAIMEIVVAEVVSNFVECLPIQRLTRHPFPAYRGRGDGEFRGRGEGKKSISAHPVLGVDLRIGFIRLSC